MVLQSPIASQLLGQYVLRTFPENGRAQPPTGVQARSSPVIFFVVFCNTFAKFSETQAGRAQPPTGVQLRRSPVNFFVLCFYNTFAKFSETQAGRAKPPTGAQLRRSPVNFVVLCFLIHLPNVSLKRRPQPDL